MRGMNLHFSGEPIKVNEGPLDQAFHMNIIGTDFATSIAHDPQEGLTYIC